MEIKLFSIIRNIANYFRQFHHYFSVLVWQTQYLKFLVVKRLEEVLGDELIEPFLQSEELGFDATHEPPVHI